MSMSLTLPEGVEHPCVRGQEGYPLGAAGLEDAVEGLRVPEDDIERPLGRVCGSVHLGSACSVPADDMMQAQRLRALRKTTR